MGKNKNFHTQIMLRKQNILCVENLIINMIIDLIKEDTQNCVF